jgi:[FeFe] hydrogenase H-cluster maturation GTPase HydF
MNKTPRGLRLHIGVFGRRNVGKSSLVNALTRQEVSIVSPTAGTTTDPVEKPMELLPIGPVLFIDTAGIDDVGALGAQRIERTRAVFERVDVAVVVCAPDALEPPPAPSLERRGVENEPSPLPGGTTGGSTRDTSGCGAVEGFDPPPTPSLEGRGTAPWTAFEQQLVDEFARRGVPTIAVFNKSDISPPDVVVANALEARQIPCVATIASRGDGVSDLREALIRAAPEDFINTPAIVGDLVPPGELVVLVVPIDKEAPKGRLILPQVQTIRDLLDSDAYCMVVKERELRDALARLNKPPALIVTDSQAFLKVAADTPPGVLLTSFSILFARYKGDLTEMVRGAMAIDTLRPGDRVLIAESCTHHPIGEDIARVKIPRWLTQYVGGKLECNIYSGHDFPPDLASYKLVVHCGACVTNRREVLSRIVRCRQAGVPITNFGLTIACALGIFERALAPFPGALGAFRHSQSDGWRGGKRKLADALDPCEDPTR